MITPCLSRTLHVFLLHRYHILPHFSLSHCSGWSTASGWLTLYCGGSIHSCLIVHGKLPTEANCLQLNHSCSAFHKAPFWGHCCTFCTLPNSNMWSHSMACVIASTPTLPSCDSQRVSETVVAVQCFAACVSNVNEWMRASLLRLNPAKTEVTWLGSYQQLKHVDIHDISILSTQVKVAECARDLGVVLNSQLSLSSHVAALCRAGFFHL